LNQGSGLVAGAIEALIAALSGGGKKKKHSFLGGLIGGAIGLFTGGPAGAVAGFIGGYNGGVAGALEGGAINYGLGQLGGIGNGTPPFAPSGPRISSFAVRSPVPAMAGASSSAAPVIHITHIGDVHTGSEAEKQRFYADISRQFRASQRRG
jgi:hypothetical protein